MYHSPADVIHSGYDCSTTKSHRYTTRQRSLRSHLLNTHRLSDTQSHIHTPHTHLAHAVHTHVLRSHERSLLVLTHLSVHAASDAHAHYAPGCEAHAKGATSNAQGAAENGDRTRTLSHSPNAKP